LLEPWSSGSSVPTRRGAFRRLVVFQQSPPIDRTWVLSDLDAGGCVGYNSYGS
jgi:hypothetical protein